MKLDNNDDIICGPGRLDEKKPIIILYRYVVVTWCLNLCRSINFEMYLFFLDSSTSTNYAKQLTVRKIQLAYSDKVLTQYKMTY